MRHLVRGRVFIYPSFCHKTSIRIFHCTRGKKKSAYTSIQKADQKKEYEDTPIATDVSWDYRQTSQPQPELPDIRHYSLPQKPLDLMDRYFFAKVENQPILALFFSKLLHIDNKTDRIDHNKKSIAYITFVSIETIFLPHKSCLK